MAIYITVGTGIGGGAIIDGKLLHGLIHPEMGHMIIRRNPADDADFPGICPFHGDCLEGLAAGPALAARWGQPGDTLPDDHLAWGFQARYLGAAIANMLYLLSPERIIIGGGVMSRPAVLAAARREAQNMLAGYLRSPIILEQIDQLVVPPGLGGRSGIAGALALAMDAAG